MILESSVFENKGFIPVKYTCNGQDISPPLMWSNIPRETKSFVLICDDPDIPRKDENSLRIWDHWVVYNIPPYLSTLEEGAPLPEGALEGLNTWGKTGYGGPCPPDREHRYFFKLYALDTTLHFNKTPTKEMIEESIRHHILGETLLIGLYSQPLNK